MIKNVYFEYGDNDSEVFTLFSPKTLEKKADFSSELSEFIDKLKEKDGKSYALVNALSSGEFFGSNRNGDYFPEKALQDYHKTFEAMAHIYKHHINKDPNRSMGKVVFSYYNPKMKRVELILEIDNSKGSKLIEELNSGRLPAVSMGCKVPWDECSVCHNRAKTRAEYCSHLTEDMNKVLPNGQKVYAINRMPKFFDISVVTIPADRTAGFIRQISSKANADMPVMKMAEYELEESGFMSKVANFEANAEIKKKIEGKVEAVEKDPKKLILSAQKRLTQDQIEKLSEFPLNEVLSTLLSLRIMPAKEDFQKLALYASNKKELADSLYNKGICFDINAETEATIPDDLDCSYYNTKIAGLLINDIPDMALTKELVIGRALTKLSQDLNKGTYFEPTGNDSEARTYPNPRQIEQRSTISQFFITKKEQPQLTAHKNPIKPLGILGGLYYGYAKVFNDASASGFKKFIGKNPWLLPVLVGAGTAGSLMAQDRTFKKKASKISQTERFLRNSLLTVPTSYYFAGSKEYDARKGKPLTSVEDFIRKHPVLVGLGSSLALAAGQKKFDKVFKKGKNLFKTSGLVGRMDQDSVDLVYNDLIN